MKKFKSILATVLTVMLIFVLFGIICVRLGLTEPTATFYLELGIVVIIILQIKLWWYDWAEDKELNSKDIKDNKDTYYARVDTEIKDEKDFEEFIKELNKKNREDYIRVKMGSRTPEKLEDKWYNKLMFRNKKTPKELGKIRYKKLLSRYQRRSDRLPEIRSGDIISLTSTINLVDSKNHLKSRKRRYQFLSTFISIIASVGFAYIAFEQLMLNWENIFRFVSYLFVIGWTVLTTITTASRATLEETTDHLLRCQNIISKYVSYKKEVEHGDNSTNVSDSK